MRKPTKPYVTSFDRTWKGKEWFSSFGSQRFIRRLTDEEAASLDGVHPIREPRPFTDCVEVFNGRLYCKECRSSKGFYTYKMHRGKQSNWYTTYTCADCGARAKHLN